MKKLNGVLKKYFDTKAKKGVGIVRLNDLIGQIELLGYCDDEEKARALIAILEYIDNLVKQRIDDKYIDSASQALEEISA